VLSFKRGSFGGSVYEKALECAVGLNGGGLSPLGGFTAEVIETLRGAVVFFGDPFERAFHVSVSWFSRPFFTELVKTCLQHGEALTQIRAFSLAPNVHLLSSMSGQKLADCSRNTCSIVLLYLGHEKYYYAHKPVAKEYVTL